MISFQCSLGANGSATHGVSIDLEDVLVERRIDTDNVSHLMVDLQLERVHRGVKVNSVEVVQKQDLGITFPSISRLAALGRLADLDNDHVAMRRSRHGSASIREMTNQ